MALVCGRRGRGVVSGRRGRGVVSGGREGEGG